MRHRILLAIATCLAVVLPTAVAQANSSQFTTVEAPSELVTSGNPGPSLDLIKSLGATAIRVQMSWASVAPDPTASRVPRGFHATNPESYPASGWANYDKVVSSARARGLKVLLTLAGPAPDWATSRHDGLTRPSPRRFGQFATAVGRRYGRQISYWSIWNEPNLGKMLKPIRRLASATVYRNLYLKAYTGLKTAHIVAPILIGELAPVGNRFRDIGTIHPLAFLRKMLCLDKHYKRAKHTHCAAIPTAGFAMHPYTTAVGPRFAPHNKDDVTIGVLSRLTRALDRAAAARALPRHLPIYITEFGVQSFPDHVSGVSLPLQSDYRSMAEYMAFKNRRVKSFSQYLLRDDPTIKNGYGAFESGLFLFKRDRPKPSLISFRIPLVVNKTKNRSRVSLWGLVRPAHGHRGSVKLQYRNGSRGSWRKVGTERYGASGYWKRTVAYKKGRAFRVIWKAPDRTTYTGPATRAH